MGKERPLIFVTNDDGYDAGGINALIDSLKGLGEVIVVAPDGPRSGMSSAITSTLPIRTRLVKEDADVKIYACTGTPVDCVKLGISELLTRKPDLVVTGINHGSNASVCVLYSGTMGAAIEGCLFKIPSVGLSLLDHAADADFSEAKKVARAVCEKILADGLPIGTCLNVNIPQKKYKGLKVCYQASGQWIEEFKRSVDGLDNEVFWLTGTFENDDVNDQNTDEWALAQGYVSVVPIKVDMTDHAYIDNIKEWEKTII